MDPTRGNMLAHRKRCEPVRRESTWEPCHCLWGHQIAHVPPLGAISLSPSVPLSRPGLIPFPFLHILLGGLGGIFPAGPTSYLHPSVVMKQT